MDNELKSTIDELGTAFEQFKRDNDTQLANIKENGVKDPLLEEKLDRIDADLSRLDQLKERLDIIETKANRPGVTEEDAADQEHSKNFEDWLSKGSRQAENFLMEKSTNVDGGTDSEGGYAVPTVLDTNMIQLLTDNNVMRQICGHMTVGGPNYSRLVNLGGAASGWVGEVTARTETDEPALGIVTPTMGEIYANPAATQKSLDDMQIDTAGWLAAEVASEFADQENTAFLTGNGTNKPIGMLAGPTPVVTVDASRAFGVLQKFVSTSALTTIDPDELIDVIYGTRAKYRAGARWMMNATTLGIVRKLKQNSEYIWQPALAEGQPSTLMGYGVVENEEMASSTTANAFGITFGNYARGFTIVDRMGTRVLRDPYTNKPYVHFYTTKRVGSMSTDSNAIKILQSAAS